MVVGCLFASIHGGYMRYVTSLYLEFCFVIGRRDGLDLVIYLCCRCASFFIDVVPNVVVVLLFLCVVG